MILTKDHQNDPIVSNVNGIGEFHIKNSAKAFSILSSGLYSNKIRAVIRELSCNAVDSHVGAGKADVPFTVHLPSTLEPWFSVRDYGLGLNEDEIVNIYTTYFESTKTASNDFIGALGLGSKSPFSYTDNFTVIAIKDGVKRVYTAFINDAGTPSLANMGTENTDEGNGVEIKFAVEDKNDFYKFESEAQQVYAWFKLRPTVESDDFKFKDVEYIKENIIPGVHQQEANSSIAVMGNISYPIDVPNAEQNLGSLSKLLRHGLVMEFDVGQIEFQPSREGLSYIPATIESIRSKLEEINTNLSKIVQKDAEKFKNKWERAHHLTNDYTSMFKTAVEEYVARSKFDLVLPTNWNSFDTADFDFGFAELQKKYNIKIRGFSFSNYDKRCSKPYRRTRKVNDDYEEIARISVSSETQFVVSDVNVGIFERAKHHWRTTGGDLKNSQDVWLLEPANKQLKMNTTKFFRAISNPPASQIIKGSALVKKERALMGANVKILKLERRGGRSYSNRDDMVWRSAGIMKDFSKSAKYYYLPLVGFESQGTVHNVKDFQHHISCADLFTFTVYGVRKAELESIKRRKNWINLDDHIRKQLKKIDKSLVMGSVKSGLDIDKFYKYNVCNMVSADSPYRSLHDEFASVRKVRASKFESIEFLTKAYGVKNSAAKGYSDLISEYRTKLKVLQERYPLLSELSYIPVSMLPHVADYVNMIDNKGK